MRKFFKPVYILVTALSFSACAPSTDVNVEVPKIPDFKYDAKESLRGWLSCESADSEMPQVSSEVARSKTILTFTEQLKVFESYDCSGTLVESGVEAVAKFQDVLTIPPPKNLSADVVSVKIYNFRTCFEATVEASKHIDPVAKKALTDYGLGYQELSPNGELKTMLDSSAWKKPGTTSVQKGKNIIRVTYYGIDGELATQDLYVELNLNAIKIDEVDKRTTCGKK